MNERKKQLYLETGSLFVKCSQDNDLTAVTKIENIKNHSVQLISLSFYFILLVSFRQVIFLSRLLVP